MGSHTLVLNASYEPIHVVSWQRALQLLFQGKVEVVEESDRRVRTVRLSIRVPSILRLISYVPLHKKRNIVRFSRENVFLRDQHTCQYCGNRFSKIHLTLDHVIPVVQGGKKVWENIVTACRSCNQKKGGRTPEQAGMRLVRSPEASVWLPMNVVSIGISITPDSWKIYLGKDSS